MKLSVVSKSDVDVDEVSRSLEEYSLTHLGAKDKEKNAKAVINDIRGGIIGFLKQIGNRDPEGALVFKSSKVDVRLSVRTTTTLDEEKATEFLKKRGLLNLVQRVTTYLDEEKLAELVVEEKITTKELATLVKEASSEVLVIRPVKGS